MAELVLGIATSHAPQLNISPEHWDLLKNKDETDSRLDYEGLLARPELVNLEEQISLEVWRERYSACHRALGAIGEKLNEVAPDVLVVIGDDQKELFNVGNLPMFAVFYGDKIQTVNRKSHPVSDRNGAITGSRARTWTSSAWKEADEEGAPNDEFRAEPNLALHIIHSLVDSGIDVASSIEMDPAEGIGHAFSFLYRYLTPMGEIPMVPLMVNTFFPPNQPTPTRCYTVGKALRKAIDSWPEGKRVAVIASGGLSHTVIDEALDRKVLRALQAGDTETLVNLPKEKLMLGTSEIRNWIVAYGAFEGKFMTLVDYIPCYRSLAGTGCGMGFSYWQ